ncbi:MAG: helix-turn-helix transcriptional regulator [Deltaproteobacteria bacterium]|nr:helix-turn-helix transcriptional regulator [Deltaproteobacteria bacterium]
MSDKAFLNTREVARFLDINEKMVYSLVAEKGLPATKITGKWLFPRRLVERWMEGHILNYPDSPLLSHSMLVFAGSNDVFLDRAIALFNRIHPDRLAVFGNVGSMGGIKALGMGLCHIATSHLLQEDEEEYNFDFAQEELRGELPAVVNFCIREQGILVSKGNPKEIQGISSLGRSGVRIANRPKGTGTRLLLDRELEKAGLDGARIQGYDEEFRSHLDVGLQVLTGKADAAPAIRSVAGMLGLDFIPLRWERYDLLISRARFFEKGVQLFLEMFHGPSFRDLVQGIEGYDLNMSGKIVYEKTEE